MSQLFGCQIILSDFTECKCEKHGKIVLKCQIFFRRMLELYTPFPVKPYFTR